VTGCSSGIGRATALALDSRGLAVYATARRPETLAELESRGIRTLALDVTEEASMVAAVAEVEAAHGHVAVLVNNAGYGLQGAIEDTPMDAVRAQFETNVFGLVRLTQLVLPAMRAAHDGRVINVGSMGGRFTFPGGGYYHASKHAVEAISDALRLEIAPFGVHVSLVQPGPVRTAWAETAVDSIEDEPDGPYAGFRRALSEQMRQAYGGSRTNLVVAPEKVAEVIVSAATSARPRARYAVGAMARALITSRRLLPDVAWDPMMRSIWPTPRGD
ncbi:MAG TPA: oxidoreductase, partial [Candidatus Nanopelagicales bacterium]|nr:oxidoreductase [Candidatus Nanopelagicales bacterium]